MGDVEEELRNRKAWAVHVVVFPIPARGHVNPMMHLATRLAADDGFTITFVNSEADGPMLNKMSGSRIRFLEIPDGLPADVDRTTRVIDLCKSMMTDMASHFHRLIGRLMEEGGTVGTRPTCIIADMWLSPFTIETAATFGLSHISFWTQSAASFASLHAITANGYCPLPQDFSIPGATFLKPSDFNTFVQCYDPSDFMFRFVTGGFDTLDRSCWIMLNTFQKLEDETIDYLVNKKKLKTILPVGPILPLPFINQIKRNKDKACMDDDATTILWNENKACLTWLNQFKPKSVLYVSFGSVALVSHHQIEEIALGLEATGYPFLWVTRPNLIHGQSPSFNVDFLERVKDRAYFVDWAPQLDVLSHTSVGGFFTHGGWNSTLEGITAGVPMLGWPYFSDQPMDCKCIEQGWKVGLRLQDDDNATMETLVSRNVIKAKVEQLMTNKRFQDNANEWSILAKNASREDGSSSNNFLSFVDNLKSHVFV